MRKFAERLKQLRAEKNLSTFALSKSVNIGVACISRWENNQCDIKSDQLVLLAQFFNVSTDYLLGLED